MPPASPFRQSWWYRTEFKPSPEYSGKRYGLPRRHQLPGECMDERLEDRLPENLTGTQRLFTLMSRQPQSPAKPTPAAKYFLSRAIWPSRRRLGAHVPTRDGPSGVTCISLTGPIALRYPANASGPTFLRRPGHADDTRGADQRRRQSSRSCTEGTHRESRPSSSQCTSGAKEPANLPTLQPFPQLAIANPRPGPGRETDSICLT